MRWHVYSQAFSPRPLSTQITPILLSHGIVSSVPMVQCHEEVQEQKVPSARKARWKPRVSRCPREGHATSGWTFRSICATVSRRPRSYKKNRHGETSSDFPRTLSLKCAINDNLDFHSDRPAAVILHESEATTSLCANQRRHARFQSVITSTSCQSLRLEISECWIIVGHRLRSSSCVLRAMSVAG
ncbi:hypothetical protein BKA70DRAFT_884240 [Coprinopsis sp. MPI-PUGE-AT-0042]|nr:hypothetical protein BKA70DRAFT_884240 [Coprinopsis sp. MPI-PUGE-AT-0042]